MFCKIFYKYKIMLNIQDAFESVDLLAGSAVGLLVL